MMERKKRKKLLFEIVGVSSEDAYFEDLQQIRGIIVTPSLMPLRPFHYPSFRKIGRYYQGTVRVVNLGSSVWSRVFKPKHFLFYKVRLKRFQ